MQFFGLMRFSGWTCKSNCYFLIFFHIGTVEAILSIRYKLLETNSKKKTKKNTKQAKKPKKKNKKKIYKRANEEYITHAQ